jgi:nicotinamide-nucleotide amidase
MIQEGRRQRWSLRIEHIAYFLCIISVCPKTIPNCALRQVRGFADGLVQKCIVAYEKNMFSPDHTRLAIRTLDHLRVGTRRCVTAESCTGGLVAALLTSIPGSSDVVERGFVTYSNEAKTELLDVPVDIIALHGAVSAQTAEAMARGALAHSRADVAISITGVAGPGGGSADKPVGLVFLAVATAKGCDVTEMRFGPLSRDEIRARSVVKALEMLQSV